MDTSCFRTEKQVWQLLGPTNTASLKLQALQFWYSGHFSKLSCGGVECSNIAKGDVFKWPLLTPVLSVELVRSSANSKAQKGFLADWPIHSLCAYYKMVGLYRSQITEKPNFSFRNEVLNHFEENSMRYFPSSGLKFCVSQFYVSILKPTCITASPAEWMPTWTCMGMSNFLMGFVS